MAAAGLFSSCARPAASLPSERSFSSWSCAELKKRARSSMTWTRMEVTCWQSRIMAGRCSAGTASTSVGSSTIKSPGGDVNREYGNRPVTSPARHSTSLWCVPPRTRWSDARPDSRMCISATGEADVTTAAPTSNRRSSPCAAIQASSSRGALPSVRCPASRSTSVSRPGAGMNCLRFMRGWCGVRWMQQSCRFHGRPWSTRLEDGPRQATRAARTPPRAAGDRSQPATASSGGA